MTQQELADRTNVTRQTIIALEAGKYTPSLASAFRLASVFNCRVEDVFQFSNGRRSPWGDAIRGLTHLWPRAVASENGGGSGRLRTQADENC